MQMALSVRHVQPVPRCLFFIATPGAANNEVRSGIFLAVSMSIFLGEPVFEMIRVILGTVRDKTHKGSPLP